MNKRKGWLTITGTQWDENDTESVTETAAPAEYFAGDASHYIFYEEAGDSPEKVTKNTIKLKGNTLELKKQGVVNTRLVFEPGKEHMTLYSTPFGALPLGILTESLKNTYSEDIFQIHAEYCLTSQGSPICRCKIFIKITFQR